VCYYYYYFFLSLSSYFVFYSFTICDSNSISDFPSPKLESNCCKYTYALDGRNTILLLLLLSIYNKCKYSIYLVLSSIYTIAINSRRKKFETSVLEISFRYTVITLQSRSWRRYITHNIDSKKNRILSANTTLWK